MPSGVRCVNEQKIYLARNNKKSQVNCLALTVSISVIKSVYGTRIWYSRILKIYWEKSHSHFAILQIWQRRHIHEFARDEIAYRYDVSSCYWLEGINPEIALKIPLGRERAHVQRFVMQLPMVLL